MRTVLSIHLAMVSALGLASCSPAQKPLSGPGEMRLAGQTVASLGDPTVPGLWLRTTLVKEQGVGQVRNVRTGVAALAELRPMPGPQNAGAQASRTMMAALGVPLTDLPVIEVYTPVSPLRGDSGHISRLYGGGATLFRRHGQDDKDRVT